MSTLSGKKIQRKPVPSISATGGGSTISRLVARKLGVPVAAAPGVSALLQRRAGAGGGMMSVGALENYLGSASGSSLSPDVQRKVDDGFGRDMSAVRVHTDSKADVACKSLGAQAFANNNNIFFAQGKYDPGSKSGMHLLAHEATHTIQQTGGGAAQARLEVGAVDSSAETEADSVADVVVQRSEAGGDTSAEGGDADAAGAAASQASGPLSGSTFEDPQNPGVPDPAQGVAAAGGGPVSGGGQALSPADAPAGDVGQAKLAVGERNDRYEQEADAVADKVVAKVGGGNNDVQRQPEPGEWRVIGGGSRSISGPTGGTEVQRSPAGDGPIAISSMGGAPEIQKLDPATISAAAAVVGITYSFVKDLLNQTANDITYSFDRMNGTKHPYDNTNWGQLDQSVYPWREHHVDLGWYWGRGETGMKVRVHWEGNGFSINGIHFTKRSHQDEVAWGADFSWLTQSNQGVGTNGAGYPKSKATVRGTATWSSMTTTQHGNLDGWVDAEGGYSMDIDHGGWNPW